MEFILQFGDQNKVLTNSLCSNMYDNCSDACDHRVLEDNELSGTLDIGTNHSKQLQLINLRKNKIESFEEEDADSNITTILEENPVCYETGTKMKTFCTNSEMSEQQNKCSKCSNPDQFASPNMCKCSYPFTGTLYYRAPSYMNKNDLEQRILDKLHSSNLPVDSVSIISPCFQYQCLEFIIQIFPSDQDHFNLTITSEISLLLVDLSRHDAYTFFPGDDDYGNEGFHKSYIGIIIGTTVGGFILLVLLLLAGVYAFSQKKRAEKAIEQSNPFGHWDQSDSNSTQPQLHGARRFSFEELKKYTQNFSEDNDIGSGGYGKVYRGVLPNGRIVAIKRAEKQSQQGALEFKAEIELLSRVHHKNLVTLVGFCFEKGEQMLVYEFVPNGTLKDSISGKSGIVMDWTRRLKVTLGAARGLAYLHEHANPPIIHRDIKSTNILLDQYLHAKVADFGLSKPLDDCEKDHVTTQVKGTMGYMDPDYYTSQQLTEKSDVYSFGVLMLEMITARKPIQGGKHIVKVVRNSINKTKDLYGLHEILDPSLDFQSISKGLFEKFVDLAMECVEDSSADRPKMSDVVKEIESILKSSGLNPTPESSASNSACYEDTTRSENSGHPYNSTEFFDTSVVLLRQEKTESK